MGTERNENIARIFRETARLLADQGADPYRIQAYERGAALLSRLHVDVSELWERGGRDGIETLPGIGSSLAASIEEILASGHCRTLDRLMGKVNPEDLFRALPGIGDVLARRIHDELHVETLEELEAAAHDGRLANVRGIGPVRADELAAFLDKRLSESTRRGARARPDHTRHEATVAPPLDLLLEMDRLYREKAEAGQLPTIAPHRFNPSGSAWLPVWHSHKGGWTFTLLYSNTARAHQLGTTRDWVVIVAEREGQEEQYTAVTEYRGELHGLRVIRGMEAECLHHYAHPLRSDIDVVHHMVEQENG